MMQSSVTTLASLLERTFPAGLSGLIFDCDGVMVDSRDVNIGYYNLLLREVGKPPITPEQAGYVQMSTAKEALEYIFSPEELKLPSYVKNEVIKKNSIPYEQTTDLESVMPELDILYMTRVQRERFFNEEDYLRLKDSYILTPEKLKNAKQDLCIMHPLPRVNEISVAVDDDPRACYFKQVRNGRYIRMALIMKMLGIE